MAQQPVITLSIKESGAPPNATYLFHIFLDGRALLTNQSLSLPDSQKLREISRSFSSLFEQACRPEMEAGAEAALGAQLFALFLASSWEKIRAAVPSGSTRFLVIASDAPEILNLPWELLHPPGGRLPGAGPPLCHPPPARIGEEAGSLRRRSPPPAPAPALHGLRSDGSGHSGLRAGGGGALPGRLRPGGGL